MNQKRPNQLLSPEEYLAQKNVKGVLNRIVMSLLETRPDNIERHIVNLLTTFGRDINSTESFPTYGRAAQPGSSSHMPSMIAPKSAGRRQSAISPNVLREASQGFKRRHVISSRLTSSTQIEIKHIPKDESTTKALLEATHKVDLFSFLTEEQHQNLVSAMFKKEYHKGDVIIREGEAPDNFYINQWFNKSSDSYCRQ